MLGALPLRGIFLFGHFRAVLGLPVKVLVNPMAQGDEMMEGSISSLIVESLQSNQTGSGGSPRETDIMIHTPSKEAETAKFPVTNDNDGVVPILVDSETNSDSCPIKQNNGISLSPVFQGDDATETFVGDPFLPSYKEGKEIYKDGKRESETIGSGLDLDPSAVELEPLSEDIFKVWDLGVSAEEEELFTQLNKALSEEYLSINTISL
ncbi:hypothetical protein Patl1_36556 [Pistacia atlantica]|nr:hypothetical protein Patl1_36556 [Pistacia atlantica]